MPSVSLPRRESAGRLGIGSRQVGSDVRVRTGVLILYIRWKYARAIVFDGNFSAQHRRMKNPEEDIRLADGHAFMVTDGPYKAHLAEAAMRKDPVSSDGSLYFPRH